MNVDPGLFLFAFLVNLAYVAEQWDIISLLFECFFIMTICLTLKIEYQEVPYGLIRGTQKCNFTWH